MKLQLELANVSKSSVFFCFFFLRTFDDEILVILSLPALMKARVGETHWHVCHG